MEFFTRIGRDKFTLQYKKQVMVFNTSDIETITQELQELGVLA